MGQEFAQVGIALVERDDIHLARLFAKEIEDGDDGRSVALSGDVRDGLTDVWAVGLCRE